MDNYPTVTDFLDIRYQHNGRVYPNLDCWGFVELVLRRYYGFKSPTLQGKNPRGYSRDLSQNLDLLEETSSPRNGTLVFQYRGGTLRHAGICTKPGRALHLSKEGLFEVPHRYFKLTGERVAFYNVKGLLNA